MRVVEQATNLMLGTGAAWVLWLLAALSGLSLLIIVERALALRVLLCDLSLMRGALRDSLREGGIPHARVTMASWQHPAARVVMRGMDEPDLYLDPSQVRDAMSAEAIAQRRLLERRLGLLATLGANAPFIGLFGTVVGILQAFDSLGRPSSVASSASALAPQAVMTSIAEALVATAVGLGVAIPAVFAFNLFHKALAQAFDDTQMMQLELLAWLQRGP